MTTEEQDAPAAPGPIPTPPEFPITWDDPENEAILWTQDELLVRHESRPLRSKTSHTL